MTVVLRHNDKLELNVAEYAGAVTLEQLSALADYGAAHPNFLRKDMLNVVRADADFSQVDHAGLDALFMRYRTLFAPLNFQIYRRSAWLCMAQSADALVDYWLTGHDIRAGMSSTVRKFDTWAEAGDWLLLSASELALAERGEGFTELAVFEEPSVRQAATR